MRFSLAFTQSCKHSFTHLCLLTPSTALLVFSRTLLQVDLHLLPSFLIGQVDQRGEGRALLGQGAVAAPPRRCRRGRGRPWGRGLGGTRQVRSVSGWRLLPVRGWSSDWSCLGNSSRGNNRCGRRRWRQGGGDSRSGGWHFGGAGRGLRVLSQSSHLGAKKQRAAGFGKGFHARHVIQTNQLANQRLLIAELVGHWQHLQTHWRGGGHGLPEHVLGSGNQIKLSYYLYINYQYQSFIANSNKRWLIQQIKINIFKSNKYL